MSDPLLLFVVVVLLALLICVRVAAIGFAHMCDSHCENVTDADAFRTHTEGM